MSNTVINVEHISKEFFIRKAQAGNYSALRDVIVDRIRSVSQGKLSRERKESFMALDDVSFSVQAGDRVGIIGRNGAGKSTLLKILSRIIAPSKGRITIEGRLASLLEVGTGFHPELTGRENIFLNGSILGMSRNEIQRKFDEIVAFAEVERFLDTPVKRYSSGMYVRLAFAVAAHLEPEVLVVDEVLAVGDAAFQKKCLGRMNEVAKEGRTILFVSHNMEAVQRLCNKGVLLEKGKVTVDGTIDEVIRSYISANSSAKSVINIELPADTSGMDGFAHTVRFLDAQGVLTGMVPVTSSYFIEIDFTINKPLDHFIAGVGFVTITEVPFRTIWTVPQSVAPGNYRVRFSMNDVQLAPGAYKLVIGLSNNENSFHYVENQVVLEISDASDKKIDERIVNLRSGLVVNPVPFEFFKL
jgi:lipopolysaccharide transport system ATP-binding protein